MNYGRPYSAEWAYSAALWYPAPHCRRSHPIFFLEQLAEMIGILIADLRRDFLNAHFQILRQQVIGLGQTNIYQIMNRCVSGFRLENPGHIKGADTYCRRSGQERFSLHNDPQSNP